jgi:tripartite-type tricarboxylate transporter receptor subunit TctC
MSGLSRVAALLIAIAAALGASIATVHAYPDGPVRVVVPFPPGGTADILSRLVSKRLEERLGKPFVIENKSGAGGMIGATAVAQSTPDGYTILLGTIATHGINNSVYKKMPYDAVKDFEPITVLASPPNVLIVHPSLPVISRWPSIICRPRWSISAPALSGPSRSLPQAGSQAPPIYRRWPRRFRATR